MIQFPHISLFSGVLAYVENVNTNPDVPAKYRVDKPVTFEGTIKLHGANCGVVWDVLADTLTAQSREIVLTPTEDYKGFAKFVVANEGQIRQMFKDLFPRYDAEIVETTVAKVVLYGEWVGPGVAKKNKGSAVSQFKDKHWALFAAAILWVSAADGADPTEDSSRLRYVETHGQIGNVLAAGSYRLTVDFSDPASIEAAQEFAKKLVDEADKECPYGRLYGVAGAGEGFVWRPTGEFGNRHDLRWKSKSEAHSVTDQRMRKERPIVPDDVLANIASYIAITCTENRLNQGLEALGQQGLPITKQSTGKFVQWLTADVERECTLELAEYELTWPEVVHAVQQAAREFFFSQIEL